MQAKKNLREQLFFSPMGTAANKNETGWIETTGIDFSDSVVVDRIGNNRRIIFDATGVMDPAPPNAKPVPSFDVLLFRNTNQIEQAEGWLDKKSKSPETPL